MLYVVLRGEYLICNDTKCYWDKLGGGAAGNSEKYFMHPKHQNYE